MKPWFLPILLLCLVPVSSPVPAGADEGYYRYPSLHGQTIAFCVEEDVWEVPVTGGAARRMTSFEGMELAPWFSPDGKWLAFTGEYQGNLDVYVMLANGGPATRLTFHPDSDEVIGWLPDSSAILFRGRRDCPHGRSNRVYTIPPQGGNETMFVPYEVSRVAFLDDEGTEFVFNRLNREYRNWKRYAGGTAQDIWYGNSKTKEFAKLTRFPGTDAYPMAWKGRVYFLSDRSGRANIFSMTPEGKDVQQVTFHDDWDVRWPTQEGGRIVYLLGADIWLKDLSTGEEHRVPVDLGSDRRNTQPFYAGLWEYLQDFDLDTEGKRIALTVRGNVYMVPVKEGRTITVFEDSSTRLKSATFSPDSKFLAAIFDATGKDELVLLDATDNPTPKDVTSDGKVWCFSPTWSPDQKRVAYADKDFRLYIADVESGKKVLVDQGPVWEITEYTWSPDGKWLAYTLNDEWGTQSIWLYNLDKRTTTHVTGGQTNDFNPAFDSEGKYLAFLSDRSVNPVISQFDFEYGVNNATKPYLLLLQKEAKSPFIPLEPDEQEEKHPWEKKDEEKKQHEEMAKTGRPPLKETIIDLEGLGDRVVPIPVGAGNYMGLRMTTNRLFYLSTPTKGLVNGDDWADVESKAKWRLLSYDIKEKKQSTLADATNGYALSRDGKKLLLRVENHFVVRDADTSTTTIESVRKGDVKGVDVSAVRVRVEPLKEWRQIFDEAWRNHRDYYWDRNLAYIDWQAVHEMYSSLVPRIATRDELNDLIGQMIAELGTSHTYVWGGDSKPTANVPVGLLGVDVSPDLKNGCFRLDYLYGSDPWAPGLSSPLLLPHVGVKAGDYILQINGQNLDPTKNFYSHLVNLAGVEVQVTVNSKPKLDGARKVKVKTLVLERERDLRYNAWVQANAAYVSKMSGGRLGYIHIPDMGGRGLVEFTEHFYPQLGREGLVVDARFNGGGFVSQMIVARLARFIWAYDTHRNGWTWTYPEKTFAGHKVVLTDMHAGSDGDIFPRSFQLLKLGKVIGTRSWGGVNGIRGDTPFVDSGMTVQPEFAWWDTTVGWGIENYGVDPDIMVDILPQDVLAGKDPQLDKGIEVLLQELKDQPVVRPTPPPAPDKSVGAWKEKYKNWKE